MSNIDLATAAFFGLLVTIGLMGMLNLSLRTRSADKSLKGFTHASLVQVCGWLIVLILDFGLRR